MINHPPVEIAGVSYPLGHLLPFSLAVDSIRAQKVLAVRVSFTNHCYTTQHDPALHPAGWPILRDGGGRARTFCPKRYELSRLMLPALLQQMNHPKMSVLQTHQNRNWVYGVPVQTSAGTYNVFFELRRSNDAAIDLELVVESAYVRTTPPGTIGAIGFILLCGKIYRGEKVATRR